MKSFGNIFWGGLLLMGGVIWLLMEFQVIEFSEFIHDWWPLFIIVPFALRFFFAPDKLLSINGVAIGVIFQLRCLGVIDNLASVLKIAVPIAIILIALHLIVNRRGGGAKHHHH